MENQKSFLFSKNLIKFFIICAIISACLFIITDLIAIYLLPGYDFVSQSISELSAINSPTRVFVVTSNIISHTLLIIFGFGIWSLTSRSNAFRATVVLILAYSIIGLIGLFFPMVIGEPPSFQNVIIMAFSVFSLLFAIFFSIFAFKNWLKIISLVIITAFVLLTIFGIFVAPIVDPEIRIGIQERTMMYVMLSWVIMFAVNLLRKKTK